MKYSANPFSVPPHLCSACLLKPDALGHRHSPPAFKSPDGSADRQIGILGIAAGHGIESLTGRRCGHILPVA
jgi:hypothetical protein